MIQARIGIALDGRALGGGQRSQSYWNHRNAAPVGSITFLRKEKEKWRQKNGTQLGEQKHNTHTHGPTSISIQ